MNPNRVAVFVAGAIVGALVATVAISKHGSDGQPRYHVTFETTGPDENKLLIEGECDLISLHRDGPNKDTQTIVYEFDGRKFQGPVQRVVRLEQIGAE